MEGVYNYQQPKINSIRLVPVTYSENVSLRCFISLKAICYVLINHNWFSTELWSVLRRNGLFDRVKTIYIWSCAKTTCWSIARKATQCQMVDDYRILFLLKVATKSALRVMLNFDNTKFSLPGNDQYIWKRSRRPTYLMYARVQNPQNMKPCVYNEADGPLFHCIKNKIHVFYLSQLQNTL